LSFRNNEQGRLLLGERQICDAIEKAKSKWSDIRFYIALVHHPIYWLAEKDIHKVQQHIPYKFSFLICGHLHCPCFSIQSDPDATIHTFSAGASLNAHYQAYNIIELDCDSGQARAIARLRHPDLGGHWGADSFTYKNTVNGQFRFNLPINKR
jgi:hypothetical protein